MANISASLEIQGKGNLAKYFEDQNKGLTTFNKGLSLSEKNMKGLTSSTKSYLDTSKDFVAGTARATKGVLDFGRATKNNIVTGKNFLESLSNLKTELDTSSEGFKGAGLRVLGFNDEVSKVNKLISPAVNHFRDFAEAGSNVERAFIAIDKAQRPLLNGLNVLAKNTDKISGSFRNLENTTTAAAKSIVTLGSRSLQALSVGLDSVSARLSKEGFFGKIVASRIKDVSEATKDASKSVKDFAGTINPKDFGRVDEFGEVLAKGFDNSEKRINKLSRAIKVADLAGDFFKFGKSAKDASQDGLETVGATMSFLGKVAIPALGASLSSSTAAWYTLQGISDTLDRSLRQGLLKTLAQLTLGAGYLVNIKLLADSLYNVYVSSKNLNETFGVMQRLGIDSTAFQIATSMGFVGEGFLFSAKAAKEFGQASITAFAQLQDAASFVTTLSAGSLVTFKDFEKGTDSIAAAMNDLVNGELKNTVTSLEATNSLYNSLSASIGITRQGTVDMAESTEFLTSALKLSSATGTDAAQTVELLAKVNKVYGISNKETATTAAKLNQIVESGITTFPQLVGGLSRTASVAKATGLSLDETAGVIAALTNVMSSDDALTGFASLLQSIAGQGEQARKELQELGVNFDTQTIRSQGLVVSLQELNKATNGNTEVLKRIIPDALAFQTALQLMGGAADLAASNIQKVANAGEEDLDRLFKTRQDSIIKRMTAAMNGFNEVLIEFGQKALPVIEPGLKFIEFLLKYLQEMPDGLKAFIGMLVLGQVAITNLTGSIMGLIGTISTIILVGATFRLMLLGLTGQLKNEFSLINNLVTVQKDYGTAMLRLIGLKENLKQSSVDLQRSLQKQLETQQKLSKTGVAFLDPDKSINDVEQFSKALQKIERDIRKVRQDQKGGLISSKDAKQEINSLKKLASEVRDVIGSIQGSRSSNFSDITTSINKAINDAESTLEQKRASFKKVLSKFFSTFPAEAQAIAAPVEAEIIGILENTSIKSSEKFAIIQQKFQLLGESLQGEAKEAFPSLVTLINSSFTRIEGLTDTTRQRLSIQFAALFQSLPTRIQESSKEAFQATLDLVSDLERPFEQRKNDLKELVGTIFRGFPAEITQQSPLVKEAIIKLLEDSTLPFEQRKAKFQTVFSKIFEKMDDTVREEGGRVQIELLRLAHELEKPLGFSDTDKFSRAFEKALQKLQTQLVESTPVIKAKAQNLYQVIQKTLTDPTLPEKVRKNYIQVAAEIDKVFTSIAVDSAPTLIEAELRIRNATEDIQSSLAKIGDDEARTRIQNSIGSAFDSILTKLQSNTPKVTEEIQKLQTVLTTSLAGNEIYDKVRSSFDQLLSLVDSQFEELSSDSTGNLAEIEERGKVIVEQINNSLKSIGDSDVIAKVQSHLQKIQQAIVDRASSIKAKAAELGDALATEMTPRTQRDDEGEVGLSAIRANVQTTTEAIKTTMKDFKNSLSTLLDSDVASQLKENLKEAFQALKVTVGTSSQEALEVAQTNIKDSIQRLNSILESISDASVRQRVESSLESLKQKLEQKNEEITATIEKEAPKVQAAMAEMFGVSNPQIEENIDQLQTSLKQAIDGKNIVSQGKVENELNELKQVLKNGVVDLSEGVEQGVEKLYTQITPILEKVNFQIELISDEPTRRIVQSNLEIFNANLKTELSKAVQTAETQSKQMRTAIQSSTQGVSQDLRSGVQGLFSELGAMIGLNVGVIYDSVDVIKGLGQESKKAAVGVAAMTTAQQGASLATQGHTNTLIANIAMMRGGGQEAGLLSRINKFLTTTRVADIIATASSSLALKELTVQQGISATVTTALSTANGVLTASITGVSAALGWLSGVLKALLIQLGPILAVIGATVAALGTLLLVLQTVFPFIQGWTNESTKLANRLKESNVQLEKQIELTKALSELEAIKLVGGSPEEFERATAKIREAEEAIKRLSKEVKGSSEGFEEAKVKTGAFYGILNNLVEGATAILTVPEKFKATMFRSTEDAEKNLQRIDNRYRTFLNKLRENQVAFRDQGFTKQFSETQAKLLDLGRESRIAAREQYEGMASSPEGKAIQEKAAEERRALTEEELTNLLNLERNYIDTKIQINSQYIDQLKKEADNLKEDDPKRVVLEQEIDKLNRLSAELDKSKENFSSYVRDVTNLGSSLQSSRAAKTVSELYESFNRASSSFDNEETKKKFDELLGIVRGGSKAFSEEAYKLKGFSAEFIATAAREGRELTEEELKIMEEEKQRFIKENSKGDVLGTMFNVNSGVQRQRAEALKASVSKVLKVTEDLLEKDPDKRPTLDTIQNSVLDYLENNQLALDAGVISLQQAEEQRQKVLNTKLELPNFSGTLIESLSPAQRQAIVEQDIEFAKRRSEKVIKVNEQQINQINALEASNDLSRVEAAKQRAALEETNDKSRLAALEEVLRITKAAEGSTNEEIILLEQEFETERLNILQNASKRRQAILEAEFQVAKELIDLQIKALENQASSQTNVIEKTKRLAELDNALRSARKNALDSEIALEQTITSNILKRTRDVEEKAKLSLELTEKKAAATEREFQFEEKSLQIQQELKDLEIDRQKIALNIEATKIRGERSETAIKIANAEQLNLRKEEVQALRLQAESYDLQIEAIEDQNNALRIQEQQTSEINQREKEALENRKAASRDTTALELEQARVEVALSGYEKQVQQAELLLKVQSANSSVITNQLQVIEKSLSNQVSLLEQQKNLVEQANGIRDNSYQTAIQLTNSEVLRQRLQKEAAIFRLENLKKSQQIEERVFLLQQKQTELALKRREIETSVAEIKARAELAKTVAEAKRVEADRYATKEERDAAQASIVASQAGLEAASMDRQFVDQEKQIAGQSSAIQLAQFRAKQSTDLFGARLAVAQTTTRKSDDFSLFRESLGRARGFTIKDQPEIRRNNEFVNTYDVTQKGGAENAAASTQQYGGLINVFTEQTNQLLSRFNKEVSTQLTAPMQQKLQELTSVSKKLDVSLNVTLDGNASNLPEKQQQQLLTSFRSTMYDGLYELFEDTRREL